MGRDNDVCAQHPSRMEDSIKVGMRMLCEHAGPSSGRPQRLGSPPSSRNLSRSPGGASPRSCAVATWVLPTSHGECWNPSHARVEVLARPAHLSWSADGTSHHISTLVDMTIQRMDNVGI